MNSSCVNDTAECNCSQSLNESAPQWLPPLYTDMSEPARIAVTVLYCVIFAVGMAGNILVIVVVWRCLDMRTTTNYFLVNLSVADLLFLLLCVPVGLMETWIQYPWYLGETMCYVSPYVEQVVFQASILTIAAISVERYFAICRPLQAMYVLTRRRTFIAIALVWLLCLLLCSPVITITIFQVDKYQKDECSPIYLAHNCLSIARTAPAVAYFTTITLVFLVFPLALLCGLYVSICRKLYDVPMTESRDCKSQRAKMKSRRQVVHMLISVVALFFICLTPHRVLQSWVLLTTDNNINMELVGTFVVFIRTLVYLNSTLNPVLYTLVSCKFRNALVRTLSGRGRKRFSTISSATHFFTARNSTTKSNHTGSRKDTLQMTDLMLVLQSEKKPPEHKVVLRKVQSTSF
ncbi:PREDICTED: growth hormone secretagogue receptor type 1-like [Branchiostoma belcheri]|uniref:Growth hormone secretagogue receptor type 1-like n=1 Tax=Branchiostoma belcheri TaxID=7741 RepID=A0A6P5A193_BRABE|nr:PREDICTED: growth hormone secretagogue receptor type 1-like [Branchiostoma belcheri]